MSLDPYPTDEELTRIAKWPPKDGFRSLLEYVRSLWMYPEYFRHKGRRYWLSTAGWSGNEALVGALCDNTLFHCICWQSSKRGGHHVFEIPKELIKEWVR